jgi:hypothetical protein
MDDAIKKPPDPVIMREQDEQLIRACCLYQWMTIVDMAYALDLPSSLNYVRKVAARLAGNKDQAPGHYLYRFPLPQRAGGNGLRVFVPGEASRHLLHQQEDADGFIWNKPSTMQGYSYSFVLHNLAVERLCLCAAVFCREHPEYYLAETRLSYEMARNPPRVSLTTDGQQTTIAVPDCWLYIERVADGQGTALWFEVDNATTYRVAYQRRLAARLEFITREGGYAAYFGTPVVLLCYAVLGMAPGLGEARMHTLRHWTWELLEQQEREQFASHFRFTAIEYEKLYEQTQTLFTKPVWHLPADRSQEDSPQVALLPPPQDKEEADGNSAATSD